MDIGPGELLVVLAIALILLGPSRLPKLARSLGEAMHELRHASDGSHPSDEPSEDDARSVPADSGDDAPSTDVPSAEASVDEVPVDDAPSPDGARPVSVELGDDAPN